jgi:hypothetical protein
MNTPPNIPTEPLWCGLPFEERRARIADLYGALARVEDAGSAAEAEEALTACNSYAHFMYLADYRSSPVDLRDQLPIGSGSSGEVRLPVPHHC